MLGIGALFGRAALGAGARGLAGAAVRGVTGAAVRDGIGSTIGRGIRGVAGTAFGGRNKEDQTVQPVNVSVVEGFASAVKGSTAGGGGGAIVPTGGGALVSRKSSAIVKSGGSDILSKFDVLIGAFKKLIEIEEENRKKLEDQILNFARSSEKDARSSEQSGQETSKEKSDKNPIIEGGKKAFTGIFDFITNLVSAFIKYKILEWISKPENSKAIQNTIQFFMNVGKLLGFLGKFLLGPIFNIVKELVTGGFKVFGELIEAIVNIFSLKWLTNPLGFIKDLFDIPKSIADMATNVIKSVIDFLTFGLVSGAADLIGNAIKGFFGIGEEKKETVTENSSTDAPQPQKQENPLQKTTNFIKGVAGAVLNPIGAIKNMFGGGDKSGDETPQLKEGGVVSKDGVKVEPLDGLSKISGVGNYIGKTIKMFMNLLTMPFKLVGAAMIALIMNTVGKIPGIGPFIKPILQNIISKFDLPPSLASMVLGKSPEKRKEKEKEKKKKKEEKKPAAGGPAGASPPADPPAKSGAQGGGATGGSTNTAIESIKSVDGMREDGTLKGVKGTERIVGNTRGGGNTKEYSPGTGLMPVDGGNRKYWYNSSGDVFMWQKPGDPLTDITSSGDKQMLTGLGGPLVRDLKTGQVKILPGMDQTPVGYFSYEMGATLKSKGTDGQGRSKTGATSDAWEKPTDNRFGPTIPFESSPPTKAKGGWISGPQSGYPVSLDGGMSTAFIGHGTEWVGFRKANGGSLNSAFIIPYDTPATRSNGGLIGRRIREAKSGGYALPYASGGPVHNTAAEPTVTKGSGQNPSTGGLPAVINVGKQLISKGFTVKEHPNFAGRSFDPSGNQRVGGHSNGSLHYKKLALDVTDWRSGDWLGRTKQLAEALYQKRNELKLTQIIHDPWGSWFAGEGSKGGAIGGHPTHLHLGFASGPGGGDVGDTGAGSGAAGSTGAAAGGDTSSSGGAASSGFMGSGASEAQLKYLMANLGMSSSGQQLSDVQTKNIVAQSFAGAGKPGGVQVIASENKDISSATSMIESGNLGRTLPKDGKWATYPFNF